MTVLSDSTIQQRFSQLILGGDPSRAGGCDYDFVTGKINCTGSDGKTNEQEVIDWTSKPQDSWPAETSHLFKPGALIVLRTREVIKMPPDCCGLWYQTDALSRQGLLLVNMSIIPPGYEGPLTCTFVNFGKNSISISPDTRIAKVLFLPLDKVATRQSKIQIEREYDRKLLELARGSPATFLQMSDHTKKIESIITEGKKEIADHGKSISNALGNEAVKRILIAAPLVAIVIALLAASQWFASNYLSNNVERLAKERADQIEERINVQLQKIGNKPVIVYSGSAETKMLLDRINSLENEVKTLRRKEK